MSTACTIDPTTSVCRTYWPGHGMHFVHANRVAREPWGWRDATVVDVAADGWVTAAYVSSGVHVRLWHHAALEAERAEPVRVHEGLHALAGAFGMVNVIVDGGVGAVPAPADDAAVVTTVAVTDLRTGRAVLPGEWGV